METASPTDCETPRRPFLLAKNLKTRRAVLFRPRCKLWSCPYCALVNRGLWAIRGFHGAEIFAEAGKKIDFLTLTSHERLTRESSRLVFPSAWSMLRRRAQRAGEQFDYLLIPEQHKDGRLHIHAIETAHLGTSWWKDNARASGMGYIDEEEETRSPAGAAFYVVKYLTKSISYTAWPRGFRRVRTSQSWPKLPDMPRVEGWTFETLPHSSSLDETYSKYEQAGFAIEIMGSNEAWRFVSEDIE